MIVSHEPISSEGKEEGGATVFTVGAQSAERHPGPRCWLTKEVRSKEDLGLLRI